MHKRYNIMVFTHLIPVRVTSGQREEVLIGCLYIFGYLELLIGFPHLIAIEVTSGQCDRGRGAITSIHSGVNCHSKREGSDGPTGGVGTVTAEKNRKTPLL